MDVELMAQMRTSRRMGRSAWKRNAAAAAQAGFDVMPYITVTEANAEVAAMVARQREDS